MKTLLINLFLCVVLFSCSVKDECEDNSDTISITLRSDNVAKKYPLLPENTYVLGVIDNIYARPTSNSAEFILSNEILKLNGVVINDFVKNEKVGENTVKYSSTCIYSDKDGEYVCECNPDMTIAEKTFQMLDTAHLWVKKIEFNRQYQSQGLGGKPDVYLELDNTGITSAVTGAYDRATMGNKVWDINDTITISESNFNLKIKIWDRDQFSDDDLLDDYTIMGTDINNWDTGADTVWVQYGYFTFDVVKL